MELLVQNACAGGHPLHVAGPNDAAFPRGVAMLHFTGIDESDRFKTPVRVLAYAAFRTVCRKGVWARVVQQQERAERLAVRLIGEH